MIRWRGRRTFVGVRSDRAAQRHCVMPIALAGCGGGGGAAPPTPSRAAASPAAPIAPARCTLSGRIVIAQRAGRASSPASGCASPRGGYATIGEGVALVSDAADLEREVRAPRGEGALRVPAPRRRRPRAAIARGRRFALDLRTLSPRARGVRQRARRGALRARLPRAAPARHARAACGRCRRRARTRSPRCSRSSPASTAASSGIDARPAARRAVRAGRPVAAAHVPVATPRPIVSVLPCAPCCVSRFQRDRARRVQGAGIVEHHDRSTTVMRRRCCACAARRRTGAGRVPGRAAGTRIAQRMVREAERLPAVRSRRVRAARSAWTARSSASAFAALSARLGGRRCAVRGGTSRSRASTRCWSQQLGLSDVARPPAGRGAPACALARARQRGRRARARPGSTTRRRPRRRTSCTRGEAITRAEAAWSLAPCCSSTVPAGLRARRARPAPASPTAHRSAPRCDRGSKSACRTSGAADRRRRLVVRLQATAATTARAGLARLQARPSAGGRAHPRPHRRAMAARSRARSACTWTSAARRPAVLRRTRSGSAYGRTSPRRHRAGQRLDDQRLVQGVTVAPLSEDWRGSASARAGCFGPAAGAAPRPARRVAEPAELGGVAAEEQADVPVDEQAQLALDARHHRQVVACAPATRRARRATGCRASGDRLAAAHVDEHAERPVGERAHAAACRASRRRCARRGGPGGSRAARSAATALSPLGRVGHRGGVADRPHVRRALDAHRRGRRGSGRRRRAAGPSSRDHRMRPDARRPHDGARRDDLAVAQARRRRRSPPRASCSVRISIPRPRSSRVANSRQRRRRSRASRGRCASTRIQRIPCVRQRG